MRHNRIMLIFDVFNAHDMATIKSVQQAKRKVPTAFTCPARQGDKSAISELTPPMKGIVPFYAFVKLPTRARVHTSLTTPMAEDGGFSRQQAQIWSLRGPQCITLNRLVTPAQVHFLLGVSLSQSKEMRWEIWAIIYQFIQWGCFITGPPHVTHYRKGRWLRKYFQPWKHTPAH